MDSTSGLVFVWRAIGKAGGLKYVKRQNYSETKNKELAVIRVGKQSKVRLLLNRSALTLYYLC